MSAFHVFIAIGCVVVIAAGQLLFKAVGVSLASAGTVADSKVIGIGTLAVTLYFLATLLWIWLLQHVTLSQAYPYMALSFVIVPAMSMLLFGDRLSYQYLAGMFLVLAGLLTITLDRGH